MTKFMSDSSITAISLRIIESEGNRIEKNIVDDIVSKYASGDVDGFEKYCISRVMEIIALRKVVGYLKSHISRELSGG